jgi:hypothetical protein
MKQTVDKDRNQEHTREEPSARPEASEHGHTGEGAASAMAHLISQQSDKHHGPAAESGDAR